MNSGNAQFSANWRRSQACSRCRNQKIRCEYETPESQRCKRCEKVDADCVIYTPPTRNTAGRKTKNGDNSITKTNQQKTITTTTTTTSTSTLRRGRKKPRLLTSPNDTTTEPRSGSSLSTVKPLTAILQSVSGLVHDNNLSTDKRIEQLTELLEAAKNGINELTAGHEQPYVWGYPMLNLELVSADDCLQTAINQNLYTFEEVNHYYEMFCTEFIHMTAMDIPYLPYREAIVKRPILTLAMVTSSALSCSLDKAESRTTFFERILEERIMIKQILSLELAQSMMMSAFFIATGNTFLGSSLVGAMAGVMDCGLIDDPEKFNKVCNRELPPEEDDICIQGLSLFAGISAALLAISLHTYKRRCIYWVASYTDTLIKLKNGRVLSGVHNSCIEYVILASRTAEMLEKLKKTTDEWELLNLCHNGIKDVEKAKKEIWTANENPIEFQFFDVMFTQLSSTFSESGIFRLSACLYTGHCAVWKSPKFAEICNRSHAAVLKLINHFLAITSAHQGFPKYFFFRPIRGIMVLVRLAKIKARILQVTGGGANLMSKSKSWKTFLTRSYDEELSYYMERTEKIWVRLIKTSKMAADNFRHFEHLKNWYLGMKKASVFDTKTPSGSDSYLVKEFFDKIMEDPANATNQVHLQEQQHQSLQLQTHKQQTQRDSEMSDTSQSQPQSFPGSTNASSTLSPFASSVSDLGHGQTVLMKCPLQPSGTVLQPCVNTSTDVYGAPTMFPGSSGAPVPAVNLYDLGPEEFISTELLLDLYQDFQWIT